MDGCAATFRRLSKIASRLESNDPVHKPGTRDGIKGRGSMHQARLRRQERVAA